LLANCSNRRLLATIQRHKLLVRRYDIIYFGQQRFFEQSVVQHSQIIDALERDDINEAVRILEQNWQCALQMVLISPKWSD